MERHGTPGDIFIVNRALHDSYFGNARGRRGTAGDIGGFVSNRQPFHLSPAQRCRIAFWLNLTQRELIGARSAGLNRPPDFSSRQADDLIGRILIDFDPPAAHSSYVPGAGWHDHRYFDSQQVGRVGVDWEDTNDANDSRSF